MRPSSAARRRNSPTSSDAPGAARPRRHREKPPLKQLKQLDLFGNDVADDDNPILTIASERLRVLEDLLSHDQWDPVDGREELWREVDDMLTRYRGYRTVLRVPARPELLVPFRRNHMTLTLRPAIDMLDLEGIQCLLDARADINACFATEDYSGCTPLTYAVLRGDTATVRLLLRRGADVNRKDDDNYAPLHCAESAAHVRMLLAAHADVNIIGPEHKSPLHMVRGPETIQVLLAAGARLEARDGNGETPLMVAVCEGVDALGDVRCLLEAGADVHAGNASGETPLYEALSFNYRAWGRWPYRAAFDVSNGLAMVQLLCAHGADKSQVELHTRSILNPDMTWNFPGRAAAQAALREWFTTSEHWRTPLHHFDILGAPHVRKLLRDPWTLHEPPADPTSSGVLKPLDLALSKPEGARSDAACLIVRAAARWSPLSHDVYPADARRLAVLLAPIGYHLEYHRGFRGLGEVWVRHVLPWVVSRASRRPLGVADVLAMRGPQLADELRFRRLERPATKSAMVGALLEAIGAIARDPDSESESGSAEDKE